MFKFLRLAGKMSLANLYKYNVLFMDLLSSVATEILHPHMTARFNIRN